MAKLSDKPLHGGINLASTLAGFLDGALGRFDLPTLAKAMGHAVPSEQFAGTASAWQLRPRPGAVLTAIDQLIMLRAGANKPVGMGATASYTGITAEQRPIVYPDGSGVEDDAWLEGQWLLMAYAPDASINAGKFVLLLPERKLRPYVALQRGTEDPNHLIATTRAGSVAGPVGDHLFGYRAFAAPASGGVDLTVTGFVADARPVLLPDGSMVPAGAWSAGNLILLDFQPVGGFWTLLAPAVSIQSAQEARAAFYTMRLLQSA